MGDGAVLGKLPRLAVWSAGCADPAQPLVIGDDVEVGARAVLFAGAWITGETQVEDGAAVGARVMTMNDDTMARRDPRRPMTAPRLGAGCRIGAAARLLPGVEVGAGARVAPGSLVTRDVASGVRVAGSPARPF